MYFYGRYDYAHLKSLQALAECRISSLPIDLNYVVGCYGIKITSFSQDKQKCLPAFGFTDTINGSKAIFVNSAEPLDTRRLLVGHELGHILLNHPLEKVCVGNSLPGLLEAQADAFSQSILAPACVLNALGVKTAQDIMKFCDISYQAAQIRLERLNVLRERNAFLRSPLERAVLENFRMFIHSNLL